MTSAEIITIGTELLLGETADTNTRFIARTLRGLGVDLFRATTVGDNVARIAQAIRESMERAEIVITTGGLGPTVDDPTRAAVARAAGVELEFRPELWEQVTARVARYGRAAGENQRRQAYLPQGAIAIENPVGTAPAFIVEQGRKSIICLPGVPREMETLLTQAVIPYLQKRYDLHEVIKIRTLHTAGVGESAIDEKIGDLESNANPTVGLTAHSGIVDIRIAAKARSMAEAGRMIAEVEAEIRQRLGQVIFGVDDDTLEGVTLQAVAKRGWSLACLEAGLGGALIERLARVQNPAFLGGSRLEVPPEGLAEALEEVRRDKNSSLALGIALSILGEQQNITIHVLTPQGNEERHLTYGGHPRNAPRWATNIGLNILRRRAQGISD
ncbi:MAG: CinA family nicotinamide mononucleotide deamidase-related protein [Chloroflexi bacterium]|nr:CinA family nicotinamide mononucleotide deamidase-related protein [Chloroflexota bacterium]